MKFAYYPGCSLEHTGRPYDESVRAVFAALGVELQEIDDWNCCGATMYMSCQKTVGYSLSARNLAIAQNLGLDICAPCSSCYTILRKTNRHLAFEPEARDRINDALSAADLSYDGQVETRHPLDILVNDVGLDVIANKAQRPLAGLRVAPYYGCQIVRPHYHFDDLDEPRAMDDLFTALGAEVVYYPSKVRCCGGMLMMTSQDVALKLNYELLKAATDNGANVIATACPLCQLNMEAYQREINQRFDDDIEIPILYFSQIVGLALGLDAKEIALSRMIVSTESLETSAKVSTP